MANLKSQWEFGDLFDQPARRVLYSVSELTSKVKRLLEEQVGSVWVAGEVTNARLQSSGHLYFSVKDAGAQLNCVLFRSEARGFNRDLLRDGVGVNLQGDVTVYEARGQYQMIVTAVELQGIGALQAAFEKLKKKLQAEGLFDQARKRPLPRYPRRVGIVTSSTGAAIRDVVQCIRRRYAGLELVLASCRVQGQGAAEEVACAIELLNEWSAHSVARGGPGVDLILLTRGGGSLEDLWAFNEEAVARAIFHSTITVVSAVGHEIDFTISDFVADLRAATPTAAAEIITEGYYSSRPFVDQALERLRDACRFQVEEKTRELGRAVQRLQRQHPVRWLQQQWQRLDDLRGGLQRCARYGLRLQQGGWSALAQRLIRAAPSQILARRRETVAMLLRQLRERVVQAFARLDQRVSSAAVKLRLLSPQNVLERGYSVTMDAATGKVLQSASEVEAGQRIRTRVKQGQFESTVQS
ncbi:MAG: exodeoxyribonuclease VII large subunit [Verrucomicrobiia bacterium]